MDRAHRHCRPPYLRRSEQGRNSLEALRNRRSIRTPRRRQVNRPWRMPTGYRESRVCRHQYIHLWEIPATPRGVSWRRHPLQCLKWGAAARRHDIRSIYTGMARMNVIPTRYRRMCKETKNAPGQSSEQISSSKSPFAHDSVIADQKVA
jgi:hypothetical protein